MEFPSERRSQTRGVNEWADTYGGLGSAPRAQLMQLPLDLLDPWHDVSGKAQPFKPYTLEHLKELATNIKRNGVIEPINARPRNGRFQIIAGHNRCAAARLAGLTAVPALVEDLTDEEAAVKLVDSNLMHREQLLPSEKAFAYKIRFENMPKRQGQRSDLTSTPLVPKLRTDEALGESIGESREQIRRYIRLTHLIPSFLDMVDEKKFGFRAAVDISYLTQEEQQHLQQVLIAESLPAPNLDKAKVLREAGRSGTLTVETIRQILQPGDHEKKEVLKLPTNRLRSFFPPDTSVQEIENTIFEALTAYMKEAKL